MESKKTSSKKSLKDIKKVSNLLGNESKIKNKAKLLNIKNDLLTTMNIGIFLNVVSIIIIGCIIYYLNNLKKCDCFNMNQNDSKFSLNYIIFIEVIQIIGNLLLIYVLYQAYLFTNQLKVGGKREMNYMPLFVLTLNIVIYSFFVYYVYQLSKHIKDDCECAQRPIRFLLYLQGILVFFNILMALLDLFN